MKLTDAQLASTTEAIFNVAPNAGLFDNVPSDKTWGELVQEITNLLPLWDFQPIIAETLKNHFPTVIPEKKIIRCVCGWEGHFIDAKQWHRHTAAMVVNALTEKKS